jgi:prepilin-type N-terminal cleavage/methylation domain-containing protein
MSVKLTSGCKIIKKGFPDKSGEQGFTLVEVIIAFVVFLIALLGVFSGFAFSINYNAGNYSRAQALTVLQREVEHLRTAKFTPYITDASLTGGTKAPRTVVSADGNRYIIRTIVDDDPFTAGVQTELAKKFKEITITVSLENPTPGWQTAVPVTTVLRRVRAN